MTLTFDIVFLKILNSLKKKMNNVLYCLPDANGYLRSQNYYYYFPFAVTRPSTVWAAEK